MEKYPEFVKNIDTILMGWNTYHQVSAELSPKEWVYKDFMTYVITHNIEHEIPLKLLHTQSYNGMTDLVYTRR